MLRHGCKLSSGNNRCVYFELDLYTDLILHRPLDSGGGGGGGGGGQPPLVLLIVGLASYILQKGAPPLPFGKFPALAIRENSTCLYFKIKPTLIIKTSRRSQPFPSPSRAGRQPRFELGVFYRPFKALARRNNTIFC